MATTKKRASFSKTPHIAVQAVVSNLEEVEAPAPIPTIEPESDEAFDKILSENVEDSALSKKNVWIYRLGLIGASIVIVLSLGIFLLALSQSKAPIVVNPEVTTPTPLPTIVVDLKSITIEVLNGSGVSGKASKTAEALKAKGYTIVGTGNAKKTPESTLAVSSSLSNEAKAALLIDVQAFGVSSISVEPLTSSFSARLILGAK